MILLSFTCVARLIEGTQLLSTFEGAHLSELSGRQSVKPLSGTEGSGQMELIARLFSTVVDTGYR